MLINNNERDFLESVDEIEIPEEIMAIPLPDWYDQWDRARANRVWDKTFTDEEYRENESLPKTLIDFIASDVYCPKGALVMDIGCGNGRAGVIPLADKRLLVVGIDLNLKGLERTEERLLEKNLSARVRLLNRDFLKLRFFPGICQTMISSQTWQLAGCWRNTRIAFFLGSYFLKLGGYLYLRIRSHNNRLPRDPQRILIDAYGNDKYQIGPKLGWTTINVNRQNNEWEEIRHNFTPNEIRFLAKVNNLEIIGEIIEEPNLPRPGREHLPPVNQLVVIMRKKGEI